LSGIVFQRNKDNLWSIHQDKAQEFIKDANNKLQFFMKKVKKMQMAIEFDQFSRDYKK